MEQNCCICRSYLEFWIRVWMIPYTSLKELQNWNTASQPQKKICSPFFHIFQPYRLKHSIQPEVHTLWEGKKCTLSVGSAAEFRMIVRTEKYHGQLSRAQGTPKSHKAFTLCVFVDISYLDLATLRHHLPDDFENKPCTSEVPKFSFCKKSWYSYSRQVVILLLRKGDLCIWEIHHSITNWQAEI